MADSQSRRTRERIPLKPDSEQRERQLGILSDRSIRFGTGLITAREIRAASPGRIERKSEMRLPVAGGVSKLRKTSDIASTFGGQVAERYESLEAEVEQDDLYIPDISERTAADTAESSDGKARGDFLSDSISDRDVKSSDSGDISRSVGSEAEDLPVFIHAGVTARRTARQIRARAFTLGNHVFVGEGEFAPGTRRWDSLLAHEMVHVQKGFNGDGTDSGAEEETARRREDDIRGGSAGGSDTKGIRPTRVEDGGTVDVLKTVGSVSRNPGDPTKETGRFEIEGFAPVEQPLVWVKNDRGSRTDGDKQGGSLPISGGNPMESPATGADPFNSVAGNSGQFSSDGKGAVSSGIAGSAIPAAKTAAIRMAPLDRLAPNGSADSQDEQRKWLAVKEQLFEEFLERFQRELRIDRERNGML